MADSENRKFSWLTDSVLLAVLPVLAYLISFQYESGYASAFYIPIELISINLTSIFISLGFLLLFVFYSSQIISVIQIVFMNKLNRILKWMIICFTVLFALAPILFDFRYVWKEFTIISSVIIIVVFLNFGVPLFTQRGKGPYIEKLRAEYATDSEVKTVYDRFLDGLFGIAGPKVYFAMIFLIILIIVIMPLAGFFRARTARDFYTINKNQDLVVLRIYGDNLICAPINKEKKEVTAGIIIVKFSDESKGVLRLEKVGPLHSRKTDII